MTETIHILERKARDGQYELCVFDCGDDACQAWHDCEDPRATVWRLELFAEYASGLAVAAAQAALLMGSLPTVYVNAWCESGCRFVMTKII